MEHTENQTHNVPLHACVLSCLCPTLCDPMDCSPQAPRSMGFPQAKILEWIACPPPGDLPNPGNEPTSPTAPALQADRFFTTEPPGKHNSPSSTKFFISNIKCESWTFFIKKVEC